jgi:hypothetical protein
MQQAAGLSWQTRIRLNCHNIVVVKRFVWLCLAVMVTTVANGIPFRSNPADYDSHQATSDATIAATLLTPDQTATIFSSDLKKAFAVVEVAVYPENGRSIDLVALDFALRSSLGNMSFAATPGEVAWHGKKSPDPGRSTSAVNVTGEVGVAIGTHTDPVTGKTYHGVATWGGAQVDNNPKPLPPPSTSADKTYALEGKLRALELPQGPTSRPIAGYLYFPLAKKDKTAPPIFEYSANGERASLPLRIH